MRIPTINATTLADPDAPGAIDTPIDPAIDTVPGMTPVVRDDPPDVLIRKRRMWFETAYRRLLGVTGGLTIALILSIGLNLWFVVNPPEPDYFATTQAGRIIKMIPVSRPYQTYQSVTNWTVKIVTEALALDFVHFRETLSRVEKDFTTDGFISFLDALNDAQLLESIKERQLVLSTSLTRSATVEVSGVIRGTYTWDLQVPLILTAENSSDNFSMEVILQVRVVRVPTTRHEYGLGITSFIMSPI